jgi:nucleotidyltransferase/DNA polymerase involved in DNA repair
MHNPRIRLPAKSSREVPFRAWNGEKASITSASKPLQDEVQRFKGIVVDLTGENARLSATLSAFSELAGSDSSPFLLEQFEEDLRLLSRRIDGRSLRLTDLQKQLTAKKPDTVCPVDNRAEKKQLLIENRQLVTRALYLERQMISAKLRLRLNHDHRDFCKLKRKLANLAGDEVAETPEERETHANKETIKNLKHAIEHEKRRLMRIAVPATAEVEAAELIQSVWRGWRVRHGRGMDAMPPKRETPKKADHRAAPKFAEGRPVEEEDGEGIA